MGWIAATAICAFSVYAVRDTMFAPLAQSDGPLSAWETKHAPGDTTPPLIAAPGATHLELDEPDESATGTTIDDSQPDHLGPVNATGTGASTSTGAGTDTGSGAASAPAGSSGAPGSAEVTPSTVDVTVSSTPSASTPDTLGGHGGNSGGGKGGSGSGSGSP
jgi:hypothetical protein